MSSDIDARSDIATVDDPIATTGVPSGAATSPAITKIASRRPMKQRNPMELPCHGSGSRESGDPSHFPELIDESRP
jgi:hypothetical protein